jgi:hypothetical protein
MEGKICSCRASGRFPTRRQMRTRMAGLPGREAQVPLHQDVDRVRLPDRPTSWGRGGRRALIECGSVSPINDVYPAGSGCLSRNRRQSACPKCASARDGETSRVYPSWRLKGRFCQGCCVRWLRVCAGPSCRLTHENYSFLRVGLGLSVVS